MIVVDTNVIVYFFLTSERSHQARDLFRKDPEWAAPLLWRSEFCNVLALYLRKNILPLAVLQQVLNKAVDLMYGREYTVNPSNVLALVSRSACSTYDCEYVALAEELNVPLITADRRLLNEFPDSTIAIENYIS